VGKAVVNTETHVVDEDGTPMAAREIGEMVHRSPQITPGYGNDPEGDGSRLSHRAGCTVATRRSSMRKAISLSSLARRT
jgi:hypothetical protein